MEPLTPSDAASSPLGAPRKGDDELIAAALAAGLTNEEAGEQVGVSARTISRRRREPGIDQAIRARRAEITNEIGARLAALGLIAVDVLADAVGADDPKLRLKAATAVVDRVVRFRRSSDIEDRLLRLEGGGGFVEDHTAWPGESND